MRIVSNDYFKINGISSHIYNLYVDTPPMAPMSERKADILEIPDREESLYFTRDAYEDLTINLKCYSFDNDFDIQRVYGWLRYAETLSLSGDSITEYRVKKVLGITPNYKGHGKNMITISFVVSPFKYLQDNSKLTFTESTFTVSNTANYWCRPKYTIYGSGDITISATKNGVTQTLTISDVDGSCIIDTERMMAYKATTSGGVTTRTMLHTSGTMPFLPVGTSNFSVTGTVTKVEILRNMRQV